MFHAIRRPATLVATLVLALTGLVLGPAPANAAPTNATVATAIATNVTVANATALTPTVPGCGTFARPCMSLNDIVCWENNWCQVPVTIRPYAVEPIRVGFATKEGTARAGVDYEAAQGVIEIAPKSAGTTVPVFIAPSRTPNDDRVYLFVTLFDPSSGVLIDDTATVTIVPRSATKG